MIGNPLLLGDDGYQISRSVRLRSSATAFFNRTPGSAGNRQRWTYSKWIKRGTVSAQQVLLSSTNSSNDAISFTSGDNLQIQFANQTAANIITSQVFRDPSAWYHIVIAVDTTQATASNRVLVYINGAQVTAFGTSSYPSQNYQTWINGAFVQNIGQVASVQYFDGYLTEVNFIDGQALTPSSFGETDIITGVWKPKKYAGTYGTNGFYLNFSDNSSNTATTIGKDNSGNGNNWTPNNISVTAGVTYDSMIDVPTPYADGGNGRGNYCIISPVNRTSNTVANGNLSTTAAGNNTAIGSFGMSSGKWYWEVTCTSNSSGLGIAKDISSELNALATTYNGNTANSYGYGWNGVSPTKINNGTQTVYGTLHGTNTVSVLFDADAGTLTFWTNGVSDGTAFTGLSGTFFPTFVDITHANFGQRPFSYTPPTGFKALNTQNLPEPTIKKGNQYFDVVLYTGNAVQDRAVTGFGFDLDFAWIKSRSNAGSHVLVNRVVGGNKQLFSNLTDAEQTNADVTNGFATGGILVGDNLTGTGSTNQSGYTYALSGWKESPSAGFDIVTYTGTGSALTVNHSLGVAPAFIITKTRGAAGYNWFVYHKDLGATKGLNLDLTGAAGTTSGYWNNTAPTSTQFTVGSFAPAATQVAYLFAEVAGFSKFGSYTGNGSADGPFVFTGFRPKFVLVKGSSLISEWYVWDSTRNTYNVANLTLNPNQSAAEYSAGSLLLDLTANGFKVRDAVGSWNSSGNTYIYAAFAESPFKTSLAR